MRVVLTRKLAEMIDGVDLSLRQVGQVFDASPEEAWLLVAEQWAIVDRRIASRNRSPVIKDVSACATVESPAPLVERQ
jgi:hypothetical protein